jgi:hypothetical protein
MPPFTISAALAADYATARPASAAALLAARGEVRP